MAYTKDQMIQLIQQYAMMYGINPAIAVAQHQRESGFRNNVVYGPFVGGAGERGISQFTPGTWARFGEGPHTNAYVPENSLKAWGKYMVFLLNRYGGDYQRALQGYNGGEGNVDRGTVSAGAREYARAILAEAGGAPPPNPTRPLPLKRGAAANKKRRAESLPVSGRPAWSRSSWRSPS